MIEPFDLIDFSPTSEFLLGARKIISMDTTPSESNLQMVEFLVEFAQRQGLKSEVFTEVQNGIQQANLIIGLANPKSGCDQFILQSHLDTMDTGSYSTWKKNAFNPFDAVIEDGNLYGIGAAKSKVDLLVKMMVLSKFTEITPKNLNPVLVATYGEQTGMQGLLRLVRRNKIQAKYALISEPTNLQVVNASKGFAIVEIQIPFSDEERSVREMKVMSESTSTQTKVFSGVSAHSADAHLGESAATKLFEYIGKLPENLAIIEIDCGTTHSSIPNQALLEIDSAMSLKESMISKLNRIFILIKSIELKMSAVRDSAFTPNHSTLSIGLIRTESDGVRLGGSCRIVPTVRNEDFEQWIALLKTGCEGLGAEFRVLDYKRPFRTEENSVFVKSALTELANINKTTSEGLRSLASTNEASLLSRLGIECLCIGAGFRADHRQALPEHVKLQDLNRAARFYSRMIERFCI